VLRTELAFCIGCLNLQRHLAELHEPTCLPVPAPAGERKLSCSGGRCRGPACAASAAAAAGEKSWRSGRPSGLSPQWINRSKSRATSHTVISRYARLSRRRERQRVMLTTLLLIVACIAAGNIVHHHQSES
jgi:hypothetical protein